MSVGRNVPVACTAGPSRSRGQALVEFAIVLPIFILILSGLIDVGRFVYVDSALSQAAREGARLAAAEAGYVGLQTTGDPGCVTAPSGIGAGNPGAHVCPTDAAALKLDVMGAVNRMVVGLGTVSTVYLSCNSGGDPPPTGDWTETVGGNGCVDAGVANGIHGGLVSVRIEYTYNPITPIIGALVGQVNRSASATMVIN